MQYHKALLIHNALSGRGRGLAKGEETSRLLEEAGIAVHTVDVAEGTDLTEEIRGGLRRGCDLVVAVGGDGTVRACLEPLADHDIPVLIVPAGTSNLVASHLRVPTRPKAIVKLLDTGVVRRIDSIALDGEPFVLAAGFGLATDIIQDANHELKRYLGPLAYLWSLLRNVTGRRIRVEMKLDDGRTVRHRAKMVFVANCAETLGQVDIIPNFAVDDGYIDIAVFHYANLYQFARLSGYLLTARWRRAREATFYRTRRAEVWVDPPLPIQIDGDVFPARSYFQLDIRPASLSVVCPKPKTPLIPKDWLDEAERRLELLRTGSNETRAEILKALWEEILSKSKIGQLLEGDSPPREPEQEPDVASTQGRDR